MLPWNNGYVDEVVELFDRMPKWDAVLWNTLITGFMQNGLAKEAMNLFDGMPKRGAISWNAMIFGYAQNGQFDKALRIHYFMEQIIYFGA